ncbi:helix-turn-helix domain-containing protein [Marinobacter nauticus]|uniref:helix-turn-helix domain-containing protein n=1 Tax=Marinobacter nauticus TaxID=2743 RepID=UPI001C997427|nr:helix-turn-helix transcriptional regulator [Marinobacter nauticus]MBY5960677.1 helix-turn-helix domain-containing protein [Marinobacter nauticus]
MASTREGRIRAGKFIRSLRIKAGLTHLKFAQQTGIGTYTRISRIESGEDRLPPQSHRAAAKALGIAGNKFAKAMLYFYEPEWFMSLFPGELSSLLLEDDQLEDT